MRSPTAQSPRAPTARHTRRVGTSSAPRRPEPLRPLDSLRCRRGCQTQDEFRLLGILRGVRHLRFQKEQLARAAEGSSPAEGQIAAIPFNLRHLIERYWTQATVRWRLTCTTAKPDSAARPIASSGCCGCTPSGREPVGRSVCSADLRASATLAASPFRRCPYVRW